MNIAYYRKSSFDGKTTVTNIKKEAAKIGLTVLGETKLPTGGGTVINLCNSSWMGNLIAADRNLIGLLPCSVVVLDRDGEVSIGVGSPSVLGSVSRDPAISQIAAEAEDKLRDLIHKSAGVGPLKPTGVKLYSTTTCPYCKMEASWLDQNKVKYEEVHVDLNQQAAEDMVKKTGQMGVPVTSIQYDGGEEEFIVGFDKQKLAQILEVKV